VLHIVLVCMVITACCTSFYVKCEVTVMKLLFFLRRNDTGDDTYTYG